MNEKMEKVLKEYEAKMERLKADINFWTPTGRLTKKAEIAIKELSFLELMKGRLEAALEAEAESEKSEVLK
jgi:hypothetical protein